MCGTDHRVLLGHHVRLRVQGADVKVQPTAHESHGASPAHGPGMRAVVYVPFEPLTALAGGLLGGAVAFVLLWHLAFRIARPKEKQ